MNSLSETVKHMTFLCRKWRSQHEERRQAKLLLGENPRWTRSECKQQDACHTAPPWWAALSLTILFFLTWKHVPLSCHADSNTVLPNIRVVEDGDPTPLPTTVHSWTSICHYLMPFCHAGFLVCVLSRLGRSIWEDTLEVTSELLMHPETSSGTIKTSWFFFHTGSHYIAQAGLELVM